MENPERKEPQRLVTAVGYGIKTVQAPLGDDEHGVIASLLKNGYNTFLNAKFTARLHGLDLSGVSFHNCAFTNNAGWYGVSGRGLRVNDCVFDKFVLTGCDLPGAIFAGNTYVETLFQGCSVKGATFFGKKIVHSVITECDLGGMTFVKFEIMEDVQNYANRGFFTTDDMGQGVFDGNTGRDNQATH